MSDLEMKNQHFTIENIRPTVEEGAYPAKVTQSVPFLVSADIFRCGHERMKAVVRWREKKEILFREVPMMDHPNDVWTGEVKIDRIGRFFFRVAAWTDVFGSWLADLKVRVETGQVDISVEIKEGLDLILKAKSRGTSSEQSILDQLIQTLSNSVSPQHSLKVVLNPDIVALMARLEERSDICQSNEFELVVDRPVANFGNWYEMFVRSQGEHGKPATFRQAEARLPDIKSMGFDVLYLAPFHPIGITSRKGRNNQKNAEPSDPGCPWAIGNEHGGHTAIDPSLGSFDDFEHFMEEAAKNNLEIAMDFAVQCSPDHPWVKEHPEWFFHRPDGTIKYAENPPMKYEDICQINFDGPHWKDLWYEMRRVVLFWVEKGVRIFRMDNPHTKPTLFWKWLIDSVQADFSDVVFLAESLTRPKPMKALAKAGFSQSYTYFIWKNSKAELTEYLTELTRTTMSDYYRPNFFVNTPDNIHSYLQNGGQPAFKLRLALAGTLSPSYGIYSGYELCESQAIPGTEEYLNSEKFEIPRRDWNKPGHIKQYITSINKIRQENPCLRALNNVLFFEIDNDQMIAYVKYSPDFSNIILVVANLDPFHTQSGTVRLALDKIKIPWGRRFQVKDLLTQKEFEWGEANFVSLDPNQEPVHILRIETRFHV